MAAPVTQLPVPAADVVGNAFAHQYYHILQQSPDLVHRFYQDGSKFGRPGEDGAMSTTTTMNAINEKILSLGYGQVRAEIVTVDSQESYKGGVLVLVTGYLNGNDNLRQKFTQSFFLAPQDKGYFVLNDVFRYVDDPTHQNENQEPASNFEAPLAPDQDTSHTQETHISEPTVALSEEVIGGEVYNPSESGDVSVEVEEEERGDVSVEEEEEEEPMPEVVDEIPPDSQLVADSQVVVESSAKIEDTPKKSYASVVKVQKEYTAPFSSPTPSPLRSAPKIQEQVTAAVSQPPAAESHVSSSNTFENGNAQESEEGPSIYVKGLPLDATPTLLENEFKKFGPIRNGGVQVRFQKGFCFGFVEFEVASAVQSALEASPVMINGFRVVVEEKRSTSRGNNRGRYPSGSGAGYKNEGMRGRGNLGGKVYGRIDIGNRTEFGNRGGSRGGGYSNRGGGGGGDGYSNRGGDGYRRADKMGNNGGRANRTGGLGLNGTAKTTAPRVSATA
ncbi:nuclear transport factor 2 isoform X2 [Populus alba x Populus x berolinensis]|uniref:Nuclear transport factor 2 isoform X2 n=1 Tax=Populus alba x Populus x berolinensis TaxID=444605 RepID=A0AAD6WDK2_9ROSI|nr:nuclear transport factor 2 isoform X2 [Populus alba x Populus x berolinensis]